MGDEDVRGRVLYSTIWSGELCLNTRHKIVFDLGAKRKERGGRRRVSHGVSLSLFDNRVLTRQQDDEMQQEAQEDGWWTYLITLCLMNVEAIVEDFKHLDLPLVERLERHAVHL